MKRFLAILLLLSLLSLSLVACGDDPKEQEPNTPDIGSDSGSDAGSDSSSGSDSGNGNELPEIKV